MPEPEPKPIVSIRMSAAALEELHHCEFGSYEDSFVSQYTGEVTDKEARTAGYDDGTLHIVEIIERSAKTVVHLMNVVEVDEFFAATLSGTFSLYHPGVCERVRDELSAHVSDRMRQTWMFKRPSIGF